MIDSTYDSTNPDRQKKIEIKKNHIIEIFSNEAYEGDYLQMKQI